MKIIISPAKKMNIDTDSLAPETSPVFLDETKILLEWLRTLSYEELKKLWNCNDRIASQNDERVRHMDLEKGLTPAILSYEGIQYQYMAPAVFEEKAMVYIQEHLRILSGFYGVLKPLDGVTPYRLEMQAKVKAEDKRDLYAFWGDKLYREVRGDDHVIVNLASKEYSRCVGGVSSAGGPVRYLRIWRACRRQGQTEGDTGEDGQRRDGTVYGREEYTGSGRYEGV